MLIANLSHYIQLCSQKLPIQKISYIIKQEKSFSGKKCNRIKCSRTVSIRKAYRVSLLFYFYMLSYKPNKALFVFCILWVKEETVESKKKSKRICMLHFII